MDFPIGKKLFYLIVTLYGAEPVTRRDTKMAAELVTIALRAVTIYKPDTQTS